MAVFALRLIACLALIVFSEKMGYSATAEIGVMTLLGVIVFGHLSVEVVRFRADDDAE